MILREMLSRRWILATILVLAGSAVCVRLGIWQLDRLAQRRASNAHYLAMQADDQLSLVQASNLDLTAMEFRAASVSGKYDFSHQVAIRNQSYGDQDGYHLLTPLILADGSAVLVDRGWIPAAGNALPSAWSTYDGTPEATVHGIIRLSREKADLSGQTDPPLAPGQTHLDIWTFPNLPRIQQQLPYRLLPVYVQLDPGPQDGQFPIPQQPEVDLSEGPHQGYAIQWFTFAAILFVGYPFYIRRQLQAPLPEPSPAE